MSLETTCYTIHFMSIAFGGFSKASLTGFDLCGQSEIQQRQISTFKCRRHTLQSQSTTDLRLTADIPPKSRSGGPPCKVF